LLQECPELALDSAAWRGSREKLRMPIARNRMRLKRGDGALHMHQHNHRRRYRHRRRGMHHDAEGAVVGVRVHLVHVRHLHHGEQRQQEQTHNCDNWQCASLCAAFPAQKCRTFCQYTFPWFKDTLCWMCKTENGYRGACCDCAKFTNRYDAETV